MRNQMRAALADEESEIVAQFQQEVGEALDKRLFQIVLGVFVLEVKELQHEGVLDGLLRSHRVLRHDLLQHGGLVLRQGDALIELAADLAIQLAHRPATAQRLGFIEGAGCLAFHGQELDVGRPGERQAGGERGEIGQLCRWCLRNCLDCRFASRCLMNREGEFIRQCLMHSVGWPAEANVAHLLEIDHAETSPESGRKICRQAFEQLLSITRTALAALFEFDDAPADFPIAGGH